MSHSEMLPLEEWGAFRSRLIWAYDRVLENPGGGVGAYLGAPVTAWMLRSGELTLRFGAEEEHYRAGEWVFPRQEPGWQVLSDRLSLISIRFEAHWVYGAPVLDRSRSVAIPAEAVPGVTAQAERLVATVQQNGRTQFSMSELSFSGFLNVQPVFMEWVRVYYETLMTHGVRSHELESLDERVRQALRVIETQPLSLPLREADLAERVGWSRSHLNRQFLRQTGRTPAALWNRRRLEAAQTELLHGTQSVKEVAYALGFLAPEHFIRWFGRLTGYAPGLYRRTFVGKAGL